MLKILKLEDIRTPWPKKIARLLGQVHRPQRAWAAEIIGTDPNYGFDRKFLKANIDNTDANNAGTRGVFKYYLLEEDKVYEVCEPIAFKKYERYYCIIEKGNVCKINKGKAIEAAKKLDMTCQK